jgi:hypothetical protein
MQEIDVAEKNKEIIDVIGRRLREAADVERAGQLAESIQAGLERLNAIEIGSEADQDGANRGRPVEQAPGSAAALCLTAAGKRP